MSYDLIKNKIISRLNSLGYSEGTSTTLEALSANEYGSCFIIKPLSGEMQDETLHTKFYDEQEWQIQLPFVHSSNNDLANLSQLHRSKDAIIKDLDNPTNWANTVRIQKYKSWDVIETPNYYVLNIKIKIIDEYIY